MTEKYHMTGLKSKLYTLGWLFCLVIMHSSTFGVKTLDAATLTYTYDSLNRLTTVDYGNGANITYTYDAAGNRLTLVSTPPPDMTPPTTPLITDDGAYTLNLTQLHALWNVNDPETGLAECQYAIGTTPLGSDVAGWTPFFCSNNSLTHSGLSLLDGSESSGRDGNLITFNWTETNKPLDSTATLSNPNAPKPSFIADKDGYYSYDLTVCDSLYCSGPDSVAVNAAALNVLPNANAGADRYVLTGQPVLLDGSKSNDPDNGPGPLTYLWSFMSVPAGSLLTDTGIINKETPLPGFTPDIEGEYILDLSVNDGAATSHDQLIITAGTTTPPVANAGLDQIVQFGQSVILDGSGSYDQDGLPQPITYQWSLVSIPTGSNITNAEINNANTVSASFIPDIKGSYVLMRAGIQ